MYNSPAAKLSRQRSENDPNESTAPVLYSIPNDTISDDEQSMDTENVKHYYFVDTYDEQPQFEHRITRSMSRNFPTLNSFPVQANFCRDPVVSRPGFFTLDMNLRFSHFNNEEQELQENIMRVGEPGKYSLSGFNLEECEFEFNFILERDYSVPRNVEIIDQLNDAPTNQSSMALNDQPDYQSIKIKVHTLDDATYSLVTNNPTIIQMHTDLHCQFLIAYNSNTILSLKEMYRDVQRYFITLKSLVTSQQKNPIITPFLNLINTDEFSIERLPYSDDIPEKRKPRLMPVCFGKKLF